MPYWTTGAAGPWSTSPTWTSSTTATHLYYFDFIQPSITLPWYYASMSSGSTTCFTVPSTGQMIITDTQYVPHGQPLIPGPRMRRLMQEQPAPAVLRRPPDPEAVERERLDRVQREAARERARTLLLRHLTEEQRAMLAGHGWFVVEGRSGTRYRIRASSAAGNVDVLHNEHVLHRLCAHCDLSIPLHDHLLAQKLMLESDESEFLRIANRHAA